MTFWLTQHVLQCLPKSRVHNESLPTTKLYWYYRPTLHISTVQSVLMREKSVIGLNVRAYYEFELRWIDRICFFCHNHLPTSTQSQTAHFRTSLYETLQWQALRNAATICPAACKLTFDLLTLRVVSKSRVTWPTSVPILVFLCLSVLDLGPMYATDRRQTSDVRQTDVRRASSLNTPYPRGGV